MKTAQARRTKKRRGKKNPPTKSYLPWVGGLLAAAGGLYMGYRLLKAPAAPAPAAPAHPQQPAPAQPTYADQLAAYHAQFNPRAAAQAVSPALTGGMGNGHGQIARIGSNGIPIINLPAESAARTAQSRAASPPPPPVPGAATSSGEATESFGGEDGGALAGEKF